MSEEFGIYGESNWKNIYSCKIKDFKDKHIAEFSYKLFNNILCNNAYVSKWKKDIKNECTHCKQIETIKHLIYECDNVKNIWNIVSSYLSFEVKWKHIVVGFFSGEK